MRVYGQLRHFWELSLRSRRVGLVVAIDNPTSTASIGSLIRGLWGVHFSQVYCAFRL